MIAPREMVARIKNETGRLPILSPKGKEGWLQAIGQANCGDESIVADLTSWRNRYRSFFQTQFVATAQRTRSWLKDTVCVDSSRVLFLVVSKEGAHIGHYGLCEISDQSGDLDNLLRGEPGGGPMLLTWAAASLIHWAYRTLNMKHLNARVFSNNLMALRWNQSLGFVVEREVPLYRLERAGETRFQMEASTDGALAPFKMAQLVLGADAFYSHYPWLRKLS